MSNFRNTGKYVPPPDDAFSLESADSVKVQRRRLIEDVDARFGFERHRTNVPRVGWLLNMHPADDLDENKRLISVVDYYFIQEDGQRFKVVYPYSPYFYVLPRDGTERELSVYLMRKFAGLVKQVESVIKEDLDLPNHLVGLKRAYLKLSFTNLTDMGKVKKELLTRIKKNASMPNSKTMSTSADKGATDQLDNVVDIREYDVPYHVRVAIDMQIFVGHWYSVVVRASGARPEVTLLPDMLDRPVGFI